MAIQESHSPGVLYKYYPLDVLFKIIDEGKLQLSSPLCFNDPFDVQWNPMWVVGTPEFRDVMEALLLDRYSPDRNLPYIASEYERDQTLRMRNRFRRLPSGVRDREIRCQIDEALDGIARPVASETDRHDHFVRRVRLFCASTNHDSIKMWSHYGDYHRGVCIGLDAPMLELAWRTDFREVQYRDSLPRLLPVDEWAHAMLNRTPMGPECEVSKHVTFTKAAEWSEEAEWRCAAPTPSDDPSLRLLLAFPLESIVSIRFGCQCPDERVRFTANLLASRSLGPELIRMRKRRDQFSLESEVCIVP